MSIPSADELLNLIEAGERDTVVDLVEDVATAHGLTNVVPLLCKVQQEVARRWHRALWSVADEHAATAVIDLALAVAARRSEAPLAVGSMVVACAEEEWHVLPARMISEELRLHGWDIRFIGASVPGEHLASYLLAHRPDVALVSCSVPTFLPGTRRAVAACHAAGVPVLAGGAGLGPDPGRAVAIGADGWAANADDADRLARSWLIDPPSLARPGDDHAQLALAALRPVLVDAALAALSRSALSDAKRWTHGQVDARQDLTDLGRSLEAALLTGDDRIVGEHTTWLVLYLNAHGITAEPVTIALTAMDRTLVHQPAARRLIAIAQDELGGTIH